MKKISFKLPEELAAEPILKNFTDEHWRALVQHGVNLLNSGKDLFKDLTDIEQENSNLRRQLHQQQLDLEFKFRNEKQQFEEQINMQSTEVANLHQQLKTQHQELETKIRAERQILDETIRRQLTDEYTRLFSLKVSAAESTYVNILEEKNRELERFKKAIISLESKIDIQHESEAKLRTLTSNLEASLEKQYADRFALSEKRTTEILNKQFEDRLAESIKTETGKAQDRINSLNERIEYYRDEMKRAKETNTSLTLQVQTLIDEMRKDREYAKDQLESKIQELKAQHDQERSILKKQAKNSNLDAEIKDLREQLSISNAAQAETRKFLQLQSDASTNDIKDYLSTNLADVTKFFRGTNNDKGTLGEQLIENIIISRKFTNSELQCTSKNPDEGDFLFKWGKLNCLIEVKNKKTITVEDREKFESNVKTSNVNSGIFISLQTYKFGPQIRECISFTTINEKPVFYVYLPANLSETIDYPILCLKAHVENSNIENADDINEMMKLLLSDSYAFCITVADRDLSEIKKLKAQIVDLESHLETTNLLISRQLEILSLFSDKYLQQALRHIPATTRAKIKKVKEIPEPTTPPAPRITVRKVRKTSIDEPTDTDEKKRKSKEPDRTNYETTEEYLINYFYHLINEHAINRAKTKPRPPICTIEDLRPIADATDETFTDEQLESFASTARTRFASEILRNDLIETLAKYAMKHGFYMPRTELVGKGKLISIVNFNKLTSLWTRPHNELCRLTQKFMEKNNMQIPAEDNTSETAED